MYTNVNLSAPVGILSLLAVCFVLGLGVLVLAYAIARRRAKLQRLTLSSLVAVTALYLSIVLYFSVASTETVLARGQEKHFCEIDCHLAYSIVGVSDTKTLGTPPNQATATGTFRSVTIKTRFDERTISPNRGNGLLYPNSRVLTLVDEQGRKYFPSAEAARVLEQQKAAGTAMTSPLRPGESYTTTVVFDLPNDMRNTSLLITEGEWLTHFVIGHENSPLHKQTKLQL